MYREIARRTNCAVLLVHHTAKPPQGSSEGHAGNMNTARGASALIGVSRIIETLFGMSKKDSERHGIPENERHLYVRLDDAKANLSLATAEAKWFKRVGVTIANGDEVGVLEPVKLADAALPDKNTEKDYLRSIICTLLVLIKTPSETLNAAAIALAWDGGERFKEYRQQDANGNHRASSTARRKIEEACKENFVVVTGTESCGFTIEYPSKGPVTLHRFSRSASATEIAAQPPEFSDPETEENDHDF